MKRIRIMRASTFESALEEARDEGWRAGTEEPTMVAVAGGDETARRYAMVRVRDPRGDRGRVHRISGVAHLQGFRGGVLLCAHGTPPELEEEARRRGMTLIEFYT